MYNPEARLVDFKLLMLEGEMIQTADEIFIGISVEKLNFRFNHVIKKQNI